MVTWDDGSSKVAGVDGGCSMLSIKDDEISDVSIEAWVDGSSEMTWLASFPPPTLVMTLAVFWAADMVLPITVAETNTILINIFDITHL